MIVMKICLLLILIHFSSCEIEIKCTDEFCTESRYRTQNVKKLIKFGDNGLQHQKYIEEKKCPTLSEACRAMNATHHGTYLQSPDVCNCCDYCLTNIVEGGACTVGSPGMQAPTDICGPGLTCVRHGNGTATCQSMASIGSTTCTMAQKIYDERKKSGTLGFLEVRPQCDADGLFAPFHCIPGSICYCVSPEGGRIFGESVYLDSWDEQKMTCGCSINDWKARNTLNAEYWEMKNVSISTARCTEIGVFDSLQCMMGDKAKCTCVEPIVGVPDSAVGLINVEEIKEGHPPCYNSGRHTPGTYKTACESMGRLPSSLSLGRTIFFSNPKCQPDGMFERVQMANTRRVCVDPSGNQIVRNGTNYGADRENSEQFAAIDCHCARTYWLLSQANVTELPNCCDYGNFEHWQCRRNECYCVDNNGDQVGQEVDHKSIEKLLCYQEYGGDSCKIKPMSNSYRRTS